jgi:DsbC/DsbD-like thiol-disulfide interchange protein
MKALRRVLVALGCVTVSLSAQRPQIGSGVPHARAQIQQLSASGQRAEVLVTLTVDPGWHVSWRNPGETGLPTRLTWSLPAGVRVVDEFWPVPVIAHTDVGATHTLEGRVPWRVVFALDSALSSPNADRLLRLTMRYGVCKDVCIPEQISVQGALQPATQVSPAAVPAELRARLATSAGRIPARRVSRTELCLSRAPFVGAGAAPMFVADSGTGLDAALALRAGTRPGSARVAIASDAQLRDGSRVLFVLGNRGAEGRLDFVAAAPGCRGR